MNMENNIKEFINDILTELSLRNSDGIPDLRRDDDLNQLYSILEEYQIPYSVIDEFIQTLTESAELTKSAKSMIQSKGLEHMGYGYYGKNDEVMFKKNEKGDLVSTSDDAYKKDVEDQQKKAGNVDKKKDGKQIKPTSTDGGEKTEAEPKSVFNTSSGQAYIEDLPDGDPAKPKEEPKPTKSDTTDDDTEVDVDNFDKLSASQKAKVVAKKIANDDESFKNSKNKDAHTVSLIENRNGDVNKGVMLPPGNAGSSFAENNGAFYIKNVFQKGGELTTEDEDAILNTMMQSQLAQQIPEKSRKQWARIALETAKTEAMVLLTESKYNAKNPQPEGLPCGAIMDKQNKANVERLLKHKLDEAKKNGDTKAVKHYEKQLNYLNKLKETDTGVLYETNDGTIGFKHTSNKSSYKDPHNNTSPGQVMKSMSEDMGNDLDPEVEETFNQANQQLSDSNIHITDDVDKFNKSRQNKSKEEIREENKIYAKALTNFPVSGGKTKDYLRGDEGVVNKPWFKKYAEENGLTEPFDDSDIMDAVFKNVTSDNPDASAQKVVLKLSEMVEKSTDKNIESMAKKYGLSVEEYKKTIDTVGVELKSTASVRRDVMSAVHKNLVTSMQKADSKNPNDYPTNPNGDNGPHQSAYVGGFLKRMHFDSYIMGDRDGVSSQNIEGDNVEPEHYRDCLAKLSGFDGDTTTPEGRDGLINHLKKKVRISDKSGSIVFVTNDGNEVELGVDQYRTKGDSKGVLGSLGKDLQKCLKSKAKKVK